MSAKTTLQGLTLIEIMVSLALVVIITLVSVPSFISLYQKYHLSTSTENLYYVLQLARRTAIKNNQTIYVNFQTGDNWCYGLNANTACNCAIANNCTLGTYNTPKLADISLSATGLTSNNLTFEGTRGATLVSSTITYTIYNQSPAISLKISALGNMYLCSANVSGYPPCT